MQYKYIVSALLLAAVNVPVQAQQRTYAPKTHVIKAASVDTADNEMPQVQMVVRPMAKPAPATVQPQAASSPAPLAVTPAAPPLSLIAGNLPSEDGIESKKTPYLPIPLAGEKSYFGEKNEYVNDYVRHYLELHNKTLGNVQSNSPKPFSVIDNVLEKKQLPKELKYIAVIESALNHNAVSHAGAVGPWQLMGPTARMMGLSVNRHQDDRRDWYKSTAAATKYLELLYSQLNDWLLVIAAYNSGPTPVQKAITRTGSRNFWDIKEYLPHETQGYVLSFIATASIFENMSKFIDLGSLPVDFKFGKEEDAPLPKKELIAKTVNTPVPLAAAALTSGTIPATANTIPAGTTAIAKKTPFSDEELKAMAIVRIKEPISLEYMAQDLGIDKRLLIRWNPDYDMFVLKTYPTPFFNLRIPKEKFNAFMAKKDELTKRSKTILEQTLK